MGLYRQMLVTLGQLARRRVVVDGQETRPRFGQLLRADGTPVPLVFHPVAGKPLEFVGLRASDEGRVELRDGDTMSIDVLGPGQSVSLVATLNPKQWERGE